MLLLRTVSKKRHAIVRNERVCVLGGQVRNSSVEASAHNRYEREAKRALCRGLGIMNE